MLELGAQGRLHRGALRRALAGVLCLVLLLAGGIHASHAADAHAVSSAFGVATTGDETDHHGAGGHAHGLGASCSLAHGCAMSAALAVTTGPMLTPAGLVGIGVDRWHRGINTAPHPHPPRLSAIV